MLSFAIVMETDATESLLPRLRVPVSRPQRPGVQVLSMADHHPALLLALLTIGACLLNNQRCLAHASMT